MIIGDLEYFMGSLPYLTFQNTPELQQRVRTLLARYAGEEEGETVDLVSILDREAGKFLSDQALSLLRKVELSSIHEFAFPQNGSGVLADFAGFDRRLKEEVRQVRLARRERTQGDGSRELDTISLEGNPLEQEVQLLRHQWNKLEELSEGHYADLAALLLYKLKLLVLLRWWNFEVEPGFERFLELTKITEHGGEDPHE